MADRLVRVHSAPPPVARGSQVPKPSEKRFSDFIVVQRILVFDHVERMLRDEMNRRRPPFQGRQTCSLLTFTSLLCTLAAEQAIHGRTEIVTRFKSRLASVGSSTEGDTDG